MIWLFYRFNCSTRSFEKFTCPYLMDPLSEEIAVWKCDGCYVTVVTLWVLLLQVTQGTQFVFPIIPRVIYGCILSQDYWLLIVVLHLLILAAENKTWQLLRDGCYTLATYILSIPRPLMCVSIHTYWHIYILWLMTIYFYNAFCHFYLWGPFFGHFRVFSSLSFVNLRATSHTDRLTNLIFGTESLYDTITWDF